MGSDVCPLTSESESYTSGAIQTADSDFTFQCTTDIADLTAPDLTSSPEVVTLQSPGASYSSQHKTTLSTLRREALSEYSHAKGGAKSTTTAGVGDPSLKRSWMSRPKNIFKDAYFRKSEWCRVFVTGQMNPLDNTHCNLPNLPEESLHLWQGSCRR